MKFPNMYSLTHSHLAQSHLVNIPQNVEANENNFKLHWLTPPNFMGGVYRSIHKPQYALSLDDETLSIIN